MEIENSVVSGSYRFSEIVIFIVDISLNVFLLWFFYALNFKYLVYAEFSIKKLSAAHFIYE